MNIELIYLNDLIENKQAYLMNNAQKKALLNNPYSNENSLVQILMIDKENIIGSVITFPLKTCADEKIYTVSAGSTLSVDKRYRGNGIGTLLTQKRLTLSPQGIAISSGLSHMSQPIFIKLGFSLFRTDRLIFLMRSRTVLEKLIHGFPLKLCALFIDFFLLLYKKVLKISNKYIMRNIFIEETDTIPDEIETIIQADYHRFKEYHSKEWFTWIKKQSFSNNPHDKQAFYVVKQYGKVIGFFMTKIRFHEQASQKNIKNLLLGSVIEWGIMENSIISEKELCLAAILSFKENVDAVEICTDEKEIIKYLKRRLLVKVGESNFAIKATEESVLQKHPGYNIQNNWRIRPAYSDNGLS